MRDYINKGIDEGARLITGGTTPPEGLEKGFYVQPTIFSDVRTDMTIAQEEIFGPVLSIIPYDTEEEAIAIANDTEFGLYDYVFSKDGARALRVAKRLQAGHVGVNTAQRHHDAPFGGFKMSGVGRDGGDYGLLAYTEPQSIIWSS